MKTQSVNNIAKKLFLGSILFAVILLSSQSNATAAVTDFRSDSALSVNKPEYVFVKYVGSTEDGLFFNVKYNNEKGQNFDILITDEDGETLYEGSFSDKFFDKKFLLPEDSDASLVTISLKSGKDNFIKSYSVKSNTVKSAVVNKN
jgi:hypothetical protein